MMVSVLLPAYKRRYLKESIDSILNQTYRDFELIVVNDASPENLHEVIAGYHDDRISYHVNQQNIGGRNLVENWNHCLTFAQGQYVVLASDDDVYAPTFLEKMIALADKYPDLNLFHCRTSVIDAQGNIIDKGAPIAELESDVEFIYRRAILRRPQVISDFMFRTEALKAIGGFVDYPRAWYADEMTVDLLAAGKGAAAVNENLFSWRSSDINISNFLWDIDQKAEASVMYYNQMHRLLSSLTVSTAESQFYMNQIQRFLVDRIAQMLHWDLSHSSFGVIWRILSNSSYDSVLPFRWKVRSVLRKFGSIVRRWYLRWFR